MKSQPPNRIVFVCDLYHARMSLPVAWSAGPFAEQEDADYPEDDGKRAEERPAAVVGVVHRAVLLSRSTDGAREVTERTSEIECAERGQQQCGNDEPGDEQRPRITRR